jgi:hypothetical protein
MASIEMSGDCGVKRSPERNDAGITVIDTSDPLFAALEQLPPEKVRQMIERDIAKYRERKLPPFSGVSDAANSVDLHGAIGKASGEGDDC